MGMNDAVSHETRYVVLEFDEQDDKWIENGDVASARSAEDAVKMRANGNGTYVAVPARSWKPMRVQQVQTIQTVIEAVES